MERNDSRVEDEVRVCVRINMHVCVCVCVCVCVRVSVHMCTYVSICAHTYRSHIMSPHEHGIPRAHARPTADNHFTSNLTSIQAVFDD